MPGPTSAVVFCFVTIPTPAACKFAIIIVILEYDADTYKPQASNKITHSDFKEGDQNKVLKNQSLIGVAFTRDSNAGSSLLKLNTIEGRLISRVQLFEDLLLKVQKRRRKGGKK